MIEQDGLPAWAVISSAEAGRTTGEILLEPYREHRRPILRPVLRVGALLLAAGIGFLVAQFVDVDPFSRLGSNITSTADLDDGAVDDGAVDGGGGERTGGGGIDDAAAVPSSDPLGGTTTMEAVAGPELVAEELDLVIADNHLTMRAVVADPAVVPQLEAALAETSGSFGSSNIVVEGSGPAAPWLDEVPEMIALFAKLIDGSITVGPEEVVVTGRAADLESLDPLLGLLTPAAGFPPLTNEVELVDMTPAAVKARVSEGELTLSGTVPSHSVKRDLAAAVIKLYGEDNVVDELEIDDATYAGFDVLRLAEDIATLQPGGDFSFGIEDGNVSAALADAVSFEEAESLLTAESRQLMSGVAETIIRTGSTVTIVGHTDDVGSDEDNLALSEDRAAAVADYLVSQGVERARVKALGKGESEPVTTNDTEVGREQNRRVVITFESPA